MNTDEYMEKERRRHQERMRRELEEKPRMRAERRNTDQTDYSPLVKL